MASCTTSATRIVARILAVVAILLIGILLGGHPSWLPKPLRDAFVDQGNGQVINQALDIIQRDYYRQVNRAQLVNSSLSGAVQSLHDPFSQYINPTDYADFGHASPQFGGIGVDIDVKPNPHGLRIQNVIPDTPAQRAGLRAGDVIVSVGTTSLAGHPYTYAMKLIRGPAGTPVKLTILRGTRRITVQVTREKITVPVASDRLLTYKGKKLGYVALSTFNQVGAGNQTRQDVNQMISQGARGIILDLRDNGGGLVTEAVSVASIFIPDGTIVSTRGRNSPQQVLTATGGAISGKVPVVVLVNRNTASASEIVTAALQDRHRALVVGTHTFGKGVFQEVMQLPNGGALDITAGYYYTPSGRNLGGGGVKEGAGVTPNITVTANGRSSADPTLQAGERTLAGELR